MINFFITAAILVAKSTQAYFAFQKYMKTKDKKYLKKTWTILQNAFTQTLWIWIVDNFSSIYILLKYGFKEMCAGSGLDDLYAKMRMKGAKFC